MDDFLLTTFIKFLRSEEARLLQAKPLTNHLLSVIVQRARYLDDPVTGLLSGQCRLGDFATIGLTRQQYRSNLQALEKLGFITVNATKAGSIVTLINSDVYDINAPEATITPTIKQPSDSTFTTIKQPSEQPSEQPLNKNYKNSKNGRRKERKNLYTDADLRSAEAMFNIILEKYPTTKQPNFQGWAKHIRDMRVLDKRSVDDIATVFRWANDDEFWSSNILSPGKLRQKFDQLAARKKQESNSAINNNGRDRVIPKMI